jgi:hypothetical protein
METNKEFWVDGSKIHVDYDNKLISITSIGDFDKERAMKVKDAMHSIFDEAPVRFDVLIDLNQNGKQSSEARKIWQLIHSHHQVKCVAFCGLNPIAEMVASFLMGDQQDKHMQFFMNKDEAYQWIKNNKT